MVAHIFIKTKRQMSDGRGVKRGTKRGPYNTNKDPNKKYKKTYYINDCKVPECTHVAFRFGYCYHHIENADLPNYVCTYCNNEYDYKKRSTLKGICKDCFKYMGQKCKECNATTIDFESGLCKKHLPQNKCSVPGCAIKATFGKFPERYCHRHTTENKCKHIIEPMPCGRLKALSSEFCQQHGGKRFRKDRLQLSYCNYMLPARVCGKKIHRIRCYDLPRVEHKDKCIEHGGGLRCDVCKVKLACYDRSGCCEDHGGAKCTVCGGPVYVWNHNDMCKNCTNNAKKKST